VRRVRPRAAASARAPDRRRFARTPVTGPGENERRGGASSRSSPCRPLVRIIPMGGTSHRGHDTRILLDCRSLGLLPACGAHGRTLNPWREPRFCNNGPHPAASRLPITAHTHVAHSLGWCNRRNGQPLSDRRSLGRSAVCLPGLLGGGVWGSRLRNDGRARGSSNPRRGGITTRRSRRSAVRRSFAADLSGGPRRRVTRSCV
jgi:hypothetical protein